MRYDLDYRTLFGHTGELTTNRLILTHMGQSMLTRLGEVEHTCANDGLTFAE